MTGPSTIAILVLLGLGPPLALPQAGLAQEPSDPAAAVEQALESGGVPALPDVPVEVLEPVTPPAEAPPAPPPAPPDLAAPAAPPDSPDSPDPPAPDLGGEDISETAPAPAPESPPTAPVNLNVDIRILSPGDDGGVDQGSGVPVEAELPGGAGPGEADLEFNWEWRWERACEPDFHAASVTLNWVWEWVDGCEAAVGTSPDPIQSNPGLLASPEAVSAPPGGTDETALDQGLTIVLKDRRQPSGGVRSSVAPAAAPGLFSAGPGAVRAPVAARAGRPALAARPETREPLSKERDFPERLPMLPAATAAPAGAGGSSATVAVALLALLCLLVPRVLEPARARPRQLSSLLSSGRLERPG